METNRIASYTLLREIGSGGMSTVYLAENNIGDQFALKTLNLDLIQQESIRNRFRNEMEALKSLRDIEQVCQIKDFYEDGRQMAIVMEYLTGHDRKIVHRDVKPSNFFLTDQGNLKILDFGIAKALVQDTTPVNSMTLGLTQFQEVMGSPMYMSPEQVRRLQRDDRISEPTSSDLNKKLSELRAGTIRGLLETIIKTRTRDGGEPMDIQISVLGRGEELPRGTAASVPLNDPNRRVVTFYWVVLPEF